ncbi:MAG TPA: hypothetical protein VFH45_05695 [Acidimicrobiales bacterium]|nr:hypothetical protein [Acidimicrobiales bacterium]
MTLYHDRWIECTEEGVAVRAYYFPWGTKRIPWTSIRSAHKLRLTAMRGRGRIWGTASPGYWASLDPHRTSKDVGYALELGRRVKPFLTPDDPDAFEAVLRGHTTIEETAPPVV